MESFHVEVEGSGPPLVLVPGFACASNVWFRVRQQLAARYQLHLITVAGFGGTPSVVPPVSPKVRDELAAYCSALDRPTLIGHSYGGFLTLWTAAKASDALTSIVVVDGGPYFPTVFDLSATPDSLRDRAEVERRQMAAGRDPSEEPAETYFDQHIIEREHATYINETTPKPDPATTGDVWYEILTTDIRPEMPNIQVPCLYIAAGQPWIKSPEDVKGIEKFCRERLGEIPSLQLIVAERARHFVMIDDPEFFLDQVLPFCEQPR